MPHENFFNFEGDICRNDDCAVIRKGAAQHYRKIETGAQLRSSLRAGDYAWPGGYQLAYITSDGALICPDCVKKNLYSVIHSIRTKCDDGWRVIGLTGEHEMEGPEYCSDCNCVLVEGEETEEEEE